MVVNQLIDDGVDVTIKTKQCKGNGTLLLKKEMILFNILNKAADGFCILAEASAEMRNFRWFPKCLCFTSRGQEQDFGWGAN